MPTSLKVLGLSDGMTGGVALIEDGVVTYAIHEERLNRHKMATGFPRLALDHVLEATHTRPSDIQAVAVAAVNEFFRDPALPYDGWLSNEQAPFKEALLGTASMVNGWCGASPWLKRSYYQLKSLAGRSRRKTLNTLLRREWGFTSPIQFIDHHYAHACSAYFTSGFPETTVLTLDGAGDNVCSRVYAAQNGRLRQRCHADSFDSIGNYYAYITHLCGFKAQKHEGKITRLAAFGEPIYTDLLKRFITYRDGRFVNTGQVFYWPAVRALEAALPPDYRREDLASSMQQVLEEVAGTYIRHWVDQTQLGHLALAGGVFANVKLNQRIHALDNVDAVFVHPGMGDEGLAVGAGLALSATLSPEPLTPTRLENVYWGAAYREQEIQNAIAKSGVKAEYAPNIERRIAA